MNFSLKIFKKKSGNKTAEFIKDQILSANSESDIDSNESKFMKPIKIQDCKHNICSSELSQYSELPRYYYIQDKCYDIDSPESVSSIPICETLFRINNELWGMDTVLREHVNRYYGKIPDDLKSVCYSKIKELEWNGYKIESNPEKSVRIAQQEKWNSEQLKLESITNADMQQFVNIPYRLTGKITVHSRNAYMDFDELDYDILNKTIESINSIIEQGSNFHSNLPKELVLRNLKNPTIKCTPYTNTGKLSKYPLSICTSSSSYDEENEYYKSYHYFPDTCGCELFYMQSGVIGKADIFFKRNTKRYYYYLVYKNHELTINKIIFSDIATNAKNILYSNK